VPPASLRQPHAKHVSPHQASLWISGVVAISGLVVGAFALGVLVGTRVTDNTEAGVGAS
jgi:hypothetical protein